MTTVPVALAGRARPLISWRARKLLVGYSYLVPAALCMLATVVVPIGLAIKMSLYNDVLYKPRDYQFIGLGNYLRLIWEWLYQPNYGVINDLLIKAGWMHDRVAWLSSPDLAMGAVVFTNVWRGIPFFAIMLLAGLQAIPDELYEAAHVDGAGVVSRFWHITVPLLRPIIVVATATRIIWTFNYADLIFVMTGGGPANATQITSTYTLMQAYANLDFGYAGALSVVLLLVMLAFTAAYLRITRGVEETG